MEERNIVFHKYIEAFKNLDIQSKKNTLTKSIKELIAIFDEFSKNNNIPLEYLRYNEIANINKENATDDDFLEASFVYLEIAKDLIGQYLIKNENLK